MVLYSMSQSRDNFQTSELFVRCYTTYLVRLLLASATALTLKNAAGVRDLFVIAGNGHYLLVTIITVRRNETGCGDWNSRSVEC